MAERGLDYDAVQQWNPGIVVARISPFGDSGPWADYKGSDLIHLALGGVMMNCGYDPDPSGFYETAPLAPQMWQAYHTTGEMAIIGLLAALYFRRETGQGQLVSTAVHQAVSQSTELDLPHWIYTRKTHFRVTCRHSMPNPQPFMLDMTKDGRWVLPYRTWLGGKFEDPVLPYVLPVLERYGMAGELANPRYLEEGAETDPAVVQLINSACSQLTGKLMFDREIWLEFQAAGPFTWAAVRRPEENMTDPHWQARETFAEVAHPELGRTFTEIRAKWTCREVPWRTGPRAPLVGEHTEEILRELDHHEPRARKAVSPTASERADPRAPALSTHGKPFALSGVRFLDLSWALASAGAGRFLSAHGADVIKVEHKSRWDTVRWAPWPLVPPGAERVRGGEWVPHTEEQARYKIDDPNRNGGFSEINAGKRAISLNLKDVRGKEIFGQLLAVSQAVGEGFSPGTMDRLGLGYERLKELNPQIVYVQQSGFGQHGTYGRLRSFGPAAQALSGLTEMSGLPEPFPPAGIGYSFLDWHGAYNMAIAVLAGIYRQRATGKGCWIDASQIEVGTYLTGTAILDYSANGREWRRYGNRSPYKPAAPHGAYRAAGDDRWIAIACFSDRQWQSLVDLIGSSTLAADSRFTTLASRLAHQSELDDLLERETVQWDAHELMHVLQRHGVPAGACQSAEERLDHDPQLEHLQWFVELAQSAIGTWPVREAPSHLSVTPAYMGGTVDRAGPNYAEDNEYVYGELLGFSTAKIKELEEENVI
jgi:crotonobetainyl-CoA:carnitine CoA-transferase CaiB-like acyl-CoA transferase